MEHERNVAITALEEMKTEVSEYLNLIKTSEIKLSEITNEKNHLERKCASMAREIAKQADSRVTLDRIIENLTHESAVLRSKLMV
jgi:chromosome segregation ATPase